MLVTKESSYIYAKSQTTTYVGQKSTCIKEYEEFYNQSLVLTCISMKLDILIPKSSIFSSLCSLQMILCQESIQQHNNTFHVLSLNHGYELIFIGL